MSRIGVMIIEDSSTVREALRGIVADDPRLEVVACVESAEAGLRLLHRIAPDVISLDIRLPGMDGLEATLKIMTERPTPIVVIAEDVRSGELNISLNALRAGALAVVEKPVGPAHRSYASVSRSICDQLVAMSSVKVVRQRIARKLPFGPRAEAPESPGPRARGGQPLYRGVWDPKQFAALGVVASTGGPAALIQLFQSLPADFPLPIALVQHISSGFLGSFAAWLGGNCPFSTVIAAEGTVPRPGCIYLGPADHHLEFGPGARGSGRLLTTRSNPVCSERPSGSVLFSSMARNLGEGAMGVLLTGMGSDGAEGLLEIRKAGGYTIAEDQSTAVVYGMPEVATRIGASCESLPVDLIGARIVELVSSKEGGG